MTVNRRTSYAVALVALLACSVWSLVVDDHAQAKNRISPQILQSGQNSTQADSGTIPPATIPPSGSTIPQVDVVTETATLSGTVDGPNSGSTVLPPASNISETAAITSTGQVTAQIEITAPVQGGSTLLPPASSITETVDSSVDEDESTGVLDPAPTPLVEEQDPEAQPATTEGIAESSTRTAGTEISATQGITNTMLLSRTIRTGIPFIDEALLSDSAQARRLRLELGMGILLCLVVLTAILAFRNRSYF